MRVLIDANVLFPTVMREIVLGAAKIAPFTPLWSDRILEEWRRAAARRSDQDGAIAEVEILAAKRGFPDAAVSVRDETQARLFLPDADDVHVLAAAIDGRADELLTMNLKDFPTNTLSSEGIIRRAPDEFLLELFHAKPDEMRDAVEAVLALADAHGIDVSSPRGVLKRARVPRLGKALFQV